METIKLIKKFENQEVEFKINFSHFVKTSNKVLAVFSISFDEISEVSFFNLSDVKILDNKKYISVSTSFSTSFAKKFNKNIKNLKISIDEIYEKLILIQEKEKEKELDKAILTVKNKIKNNKIARLYIHKDYASICISNLNYFEEILFNNNIKILNEFLYKKIKKENLKLNYVEFNYIADSSGFYEVDILSAFNDLINSKYYENIKKEIENSYNKKIDEIKNLSYEKIINDYFIDLIHITEDGYFSNHPDWCDDCFWVRAWKKSVPDEVRSAGGVAIVKGKNKEYTYRTFNETSKKIFIEKYSSILENFKNEKIETIKNELLNKLNELENDYIKINTLFN